MMGIESYLAELNPEQREAVEHVEGPLLVLAGAGSGKTRVLTSRIAHLIEEHGVDPTAMLAVTFTNKAAGELRERVRRYLGAEPAGIWIGTFHAIGARILRRHAAQLGWTSSFTIYDADDSLREMKRAMERRGHSLKRWHPRAVQAAVSGAKNRLIGPTEFGEAAGDRFSEVVADVYPDYQAALKEQNAFDFDDLLVKPVELFRQQPGVLEQYRRRFHFLLVDEYQDTNHAQYRALELLGREHGNLMVVGDDDQSIYRWRGADIRNILDFEQDFPAARVIRLERNYRSTARILDAANRVIALNVRRKGKTLRTEAGAGELLTCIEALDEHDEAEWIASAIEARLADVEGASARDFVVLYRTNAQSRALEEALRRHSLPYQIVGGTRFYERREIMDVLAYLRLLSNPRDVAAFDRIVNYPRRGIGDLSKARLLVWAAEQGIPPLVAAERAPECGTLSGGAVGSLVGFATMMSRFRILAADLRVADLLETVLEEIGLVEALRAEGPDGEDRISNVEELIAGAHEFDARLEAAVEDEGSEDPAGVTPLDLYLQQVALVADVDRHDPAADAVTLMTLHNAKGLEFPYVFIGGLEDGLFPLQRAYEEPEALEEERRLFYVGITRARRKVYLSHARRRRRAGEFLSCMPSSFLEPLGPDVMAARTTAAVARLRAEPGYQRRGAGSSFRRGSAPAKSDGAGDGLVLDFSDAQDAPRFVKGERVRHPQFGRGTIRELSGFGRDVKAVIEFETIGRKKVMLRYANLQKEL